MRFPGFTAEASLYRVEGQYYTGRIPNQGKVAIQPAIRPDPDCFESCLENCQDEPGFCFAVCNNECGGILVPL
jgi:hypothetical protein